VGVGQEKRAQSAKVNAEKTILFSKFIFNNLVLSPWHRIVPEL